MMNRFFLGFLASMLFFAGPLVAQDFDMAGKWHVMGTHTLTYSNVTGEQDLDESMLSLSLFEMDFAKQPYVETFNPDGTGVREIQIVKDSEYIDADVGETLTPSFTWAIEGRTLRTGNTESILRKVTDDLYVAVRANIEEPDMLSAMVTVYFRQQEE